MKIVLERSRG